MRKRPSAALADAYRPADPPGPEPPPTYRRAANLSAAELLDRVTDELRHAERSLRPARAVADRLVVRDVDELIRILEDEVGVPPSIVPGIPITLFRMPVVFDRRVEIGILRLEWRR